MYVLIGAAVLVAGVLFACLIAIMFRRVVPTNMVHIVQSGGATTSYGKGSDAGNTYYAWPVWIPRIGVVVSEFPESVFDISLVHYDAYDVGRLPFVVDIRAFFRISDSQVAAHRVSTFDQLREQLEAVLQGAVRRILATNKLEHIMEDRSGLGKQFTEEVDLQLKQWGVGTVKTIEFMDLRDASGSDVIANMMAKEQSRISKESRITVAQNMREALNAEIDAQRVVDINKQDALQQVGLRTAEKDKAVGIASEQAKQEVQGQAKTTAERTMAVKQVEAVRQADINKEVLVVKSTAEKEARVVQSEGEARAVTLMAEGNLQATLKQAEGIAATGDAKARAEAAILLAPVTAQITLAKEIGENEGYQKYLVTIRQVEAGQAVGMKMGEAMASADMKIIANAGDAVSGMSKLTDVFTTKGGTNVGGMLAALAQTEEGGKLLDGVNKMLNGGLNEQSKH